METNENKELQPNASEQTGTPDSNTTSVADQQKNFESTTAPVESTQPRVVENKLPNDLQERFRANDLHQRLSRVLEVKKLTAHHAARQINNYFPDVPTIQVINSVESILNGMPTASSEAIIEAIEKLEDNTGY